MELHEDRTVHTEVGGNSPFESERREGDGRLARPPGYLHEAENQQAHLADLAE